VRRFLVLAPIGLLLAGCGSSKHVAPRRNHALDESAANFAVRTQAELRLGSFAKAWRTLHPVEQRVISVKRLASCYPRNEFAATVTFHASRVGDVSWTVPGESAPVAAKEVTLTATSPGRPKQTFTQHVVRLHGRWAWMLSRQYFELARRGRC
jgi:hypothetical protein